MSNDQDRSEQKPTSEKHSERKLQRLLGVIYRLVIIFGIILFIVGVVLVILTSLIRFWALLFPLVLIVIGIILARFEYVLHKRLTLKT